MCFYVSRVYIARGAVRWHWVAPVRYVVAVLGVDHLKALAFRRAWAWRDALRLLSGTLLSTAYPPICD